jgi:hypothetical protein
LKLAGEALEKIRRIREKLSQFQNKAMVAAVNLRVAG